ncbi:MAG: A/G-specific adenine glycosylase [Alphaproteobacteria bacterium]|nr:A/G-specific adenine glycosylase [Alphaproteobacteria bacterium]
MAVDASEPLMRWFAVDKRRLPWRTLPGEPVDPYRIWLSEVMLQQTTVAAVRPYFETFTRRWPTVEALATAPEAEVMAAWAGLGYYARARNLVACALAVAGEHGGRFPDSEEALRKLPGIGRYTAAAIAAIAFGRRAVVVDANVERVVSRLFAVEEALPGSRETLYRLADTLTPAEGAGDFAQALMDLGSMICTPRLPDCPRCPLAGACAARAQGAPERYPLKAAKKPKPRRAGTAYWLEHDGRVLLVRRPPKGLLGGMLALPEEEPADADWSEAGAVEHVFTHFALTMRLLCAKTEAAGDGLWHPIDRLGEAGLPTLFARLAMRGAEWRTQSPLPLRNAQVNRAPRGSALSGGQGDLRMEGPAARRWEGEGTAPASEPLISEQSHSLTLPAFGWAPPSPEMGKGS